MKAVRYYGKEDIRVEEIAAPSGPGPKQIVVNPKVCGICGTDLHEYAAGPIVTPVRPHHFTGATLPQILGHEFSAEVIEVGKEVARLSKGITAQEIERRQHRTAGQVMETHSRVCQGTS